MRNKGNIFCGYSGIQNNQLNKYEDTERETQSDKTAKEVPSRALLTMIRTCSISEEPKSNYQNNCYYEKERPETYQVY